ncbi:MAG: chemotaxis protein CheW [Lentisphaerota bacterium]
MNNESANMKESCWNSIGVWGPVGNSVRCPKLAEMIHCRNCTVFIDAGGNLLDCALPPGYMEEWTEIIAKEKDLRTAANIPIVIFRIAKEHLALRSAICREIVNIRKIHKIPHRSNEVLLGMANVRGELQLCFSIKALIGNTDVDETVNAKESTAKMLVVQKSGKCWVFPVDQVLGVLRCDDDETQNVPATVSKAAGTFTKKVLLHEGREIGLLDDELLLYTLQSKIS